MSMDLATLALTQRHQPQTPPGSTSGSPKFTMGSSLQELAHLPGRSSPQITLPSLGEFDQGVEALARTHGPANCWSPPSPLPSLTRNPLIFQPITPAPPSWPLRGHTSEDSAGNYLASRRETITSLNMDCYPSPPPEGENRHINQKYTTEEGDFIICAWHDKKMKWQRIKQEFATRFGRTPERTVQGLQAWYYRMNQRIPIWDQEGWLCFDNEDELEPRHVGIKCRERDGLDKPMEPLSLAQRYPERAVNYSWVDPELKHKARDWAAKRVMQYRERRDRRRRKEQRRMKL
ncbi:hypothetical protein EDB81DRAFT_904895 [Dactylonectria macrodidyma]|uniref:Myb-like domain-containing protein n=1 Tax=Dactylonectria macrodidyma TaxID=307937 RepID=A0A9P9E6I0_9HYPO|nr:hypothetical protein EDB81DRAFT_904895 [Dactylonectria macrodidyma]